ncbi:helix-turn-helix domain-containing protein [Cupriavidus necator]|uniref:helix-turn-helix domain-containing protein n=1 Tax=Cupriavidus necator TaxID=106590 RepID=UPI001E2F5D48|nr:helix-turn-helix domain-containing protein [Cupriavidus necator]
MTIMTAEDLMKPSARCPRRSASSFSRRWASRLSRTRTSRTRKSLATSRNADFTAAEAAEYLEVSIATFRRLVRDGKLAPHAVVGRSQLFSAADLEAFKRQRKAIKG